MATKQSVIPCVFLALSIPIKAQSLADAKVSLSYGELQQLITTPIKEQPKPRNPELLSVRLRLVMVEGRPVLDASLRAVSFVPSQTNLPLFHGELAPESQVPEDALVVAEKGSICLAMQSAGPMALQLRLLPLTNSNSFSFSIPSCPSVMIDTSELPDGQAVRLVSGGIEETLPKGRIRPLHGNGKEISIDVLDPRETDKVFQAPLPSTWQWQNLAVVMPADDGLIYHIVARASASDGSGLDASLPIPPDAQSITASGKDLESHRVLRGENRATSLNLKWITRDVLDREVLISYRMPFRPLDRTWKLQAPGDDTSRTRFMIASSPVHDYSAEGLGPRIQADGLPLILADTLAGLSYQSIEANHRAELNVNPVPIIATDMGTVKFAEWSMTLEADGALLTTGKLNIEHDAPMEFHFAIPEEMKLLSCELNGEAVAVVDLGDGKLKVSLPRRDGASTLTCKLTQTAKAFDPVEGTLRLSLPSTPSFIHSMFWEIQLPSGYEAETYGNLTRVPSRTNQTNQLSLRKNLCRDERPDIQVFYQRSDLTRP